MGFGGFSLGGGGSDLNYTDDDLDSYSTIWEGEITKTKDSDHKRVVTALKHISEGTDLESYSHRITITGTKLHGIKALRECSEVAMRDCDIVSPEFGWSVHGISMEHCTAESEYFMMRSTDLRFQDVTFKGKYSFQYIENATFENCRFDTKDAFWHAKNVVVRNSVIKGEYLAWYCENVTFENCTIIGTQPLCYCKGLRLVDCRMEGADLAFEKSDVQAALLAPVISIKNPYAGRIEVPAVKEIIRDDVRAKCEIVVGTAQQADCCA